MNTLINKGCRSCGLVKDITNFSKQNAAPDGLQKYCKTCQAIKKKNWDIKNKEHVKIYQKELAQKRQSIICNKCGKVNRDLRGRCKTCRKLETAKWNAKNIDKKRFTVMKSSFLRRIKIISIYGGMCACCGEEKMEFLSIDHLNGGGTQHRKSIHESIYGWLQKNNYPHGFRVLCYNCNLSLGFLGYCPHNPPKFPTDWEGRIKMMRDINPNRKRREGVSI